MLSNTSCESRLLRKFITKMLTFVLKYTVPQINLSTCVKFCFVRVPSIVIVEYGFAKLKSVGGF